MTSKIMKFGHSKSKEDMWFFFIVVISIKDHVFWKIHYLITFVPNMTSNFWGSVWTLVKVKLKNYFYFTDFFAKIYSLLTHVRKTPPLRSHYRSYSQKCKRGGKDAVLITQVFFRLSVSIYSLIGSCKYYKEIQIDSI